MLALRLAGPLQAWGDGSRFVRRSTRPEPTKSGVLGLVAAAQGRRRTDPLEDLAALRFAVRVDQPGQLLRDFQTARSLDGARSMPLSYRHYLADAAFVALVEGDGALLEGLHRALTDPVFPLFLGRRSCAPAAPPSLGVLDRDTCPTLEQALPAVAWQASPWWRRTRPATVPLPYVRDAPDGTAEAESVHDEPVSFDPDRRRHAWRRVVRGTVAVRNDMCRGGAREDDVAGTGGAPTPDHDPFDLFGDDL